MPFCFKSCLTRRSPSSSGRARAAPAHGPRPNRLVGLRHQPGGDVRNRACVQPLRIIESRRVPAGLFQLRIVDFAVLQIVFDERTIAHLPARVAREPLRCAVGAGGLRHAAIVVVDIPGLVALCVPALVLFADAVVMHLGIVTVGHMRLGEPIIAVVLVGGGVVVGVGFSNTAAGGVELRRIRGAVGVDGFDGVAGGIVLILDDAAVGIGYLRDSVDGIVGASPAHAG